MHSKFVTTKRPQLKTVFHSVTLMKKRILTLLFGDCMYDVNLVKSKLSTWTWSWYVPTKNKGVLFWHLYSTHHNFTTSRSFISHLELDFGLIRFRPVNMSKQVKPSRNDFITESGVNKFMGNAKTSILQSLVSLCYVITRTPTPNIQTPEKDQLK